MITDMLHIEIQQLDGNGNVWRKFDHWPHDKAAVDRQLERIEAAYNMSTTRVLVDGVRVLGVAE